MPAPAWALVRRVLAGLAVATFVAGCGQTSAGKSSSVTVTGNNLTIYVSEPASIGADPNLQDVAYAEQLAFHQYAPLVSGYKLRLQVVRAAKVSDNARTAIQDQTAIAYLGELQPGTSDQTVGITQAVDLLQLSPTDTATMIDSDFPALTSYKRNFVRIPADNAAQGRAIVAEMRALGARSVFVADDGTGYGRSTASGVRAAAVASGLTVADTESGAGAVFYGSSSPGTAATFFDAAAAAVPSAGLFGPSALYTPQLTRALSASVRTLYVSVPGVLPSAMDAAGKAFRRGFLVDFGHEPSVQAYLGFEAMRGLLAVMVSAREEADNRTTLIKDVTAKQFDTPPFVIARLQRGELVPWRTAPAL